jgi:hypothetical protein
MAPKRWISVLVPASTLVLCALLAAGAAAGASDSTDLATQFVADLIANVTGLMQQQQAEVESSRSCSNDDPLVVDLGYAKYRGYHNATTGLNYWKGSAHLHSHPHLPLPLPHSLAHSHGLMVAYGMSRRAGSPSPPLPLAT